MAISRRDLLRAGALGAAAAGLGGPLARRVMAAPDPEVSARRVLVAVFLRGGQDGLNVLVPYADPRYPELRPNIHLPPPGEDGGVLDLDGTFGLHPALTGLKRLYDEKLLAPIVCVGSPHPTRSHFDAQDFMEYGAPGDRLVKTGWLNRYLEATAPAAGPDASLRGVAMQRRLPRSLRGAYPALAVPASLGLGSRRPRDGDGDDVLDLFDPLYGQPDAAAMGGTRPDEDRLEAAGRTTIETLKRLEDVLASTGGRSAARWPSDAGPLGEPLRRTARLLQAGQGTEVVAVDWNGWDHHIGEGGPGEEGQLPRMLGQLDRAITAFFEELRPMRATVTMLLMTEFGRTNAENGNRGTDHGHASLMLAIGGRVKGGKVHGEWTTLAPGKTYENRDLVVTTDFRTVFCETLTDFLRLPADREVFPGFTGARKLGLF